jgi:hypothetical protein
VPTFVNGRVSRSQRGGSPTVVILFSRPEPLLFLSSSSTFILTGLSEGRLARKADNLTIMPADCPVNTEVSTSHNPMNLHGLLQG